MDAYPDTLVPTFCPLRRSTDGEILFQQATWLTLEVTVLIVVVTVLIVVVTCLFCWRRSRGKGNEVPTQRCGEENVWQVPSGQMRKSDIVRYYGRRMIKKDYRLIILTCVGMFLPLASSQEVPESYTLSSSEIVSVNGSTQDDHCNGTILVSPGMVECPMPRTNSFLYDGVIPTLIGFDGSEWASRLLTLNTSATSTRITFNFPNIPYYSVVRRVRVVMFNCPQWGIGTISINIFGTDSGSSTDIIIGRIIPATTTSCDSLVSLCTTDIATSLRIISLQFIPADNSDLVYIAEVAFFSNVGQICEPDAILNPHTTPSTPINTTPIVTTMPIVTTSPIVTTPIKTAIPTLRTSSTTMTTDVQGVSMCLVEGSIYSIQCSYIAGSNSVSGCSYVLVSVVQDTRDIHGTIDESSIVNKDVPNIEDYGRILVYDEVKVLVMNESLDLEKNGSCTITEATITITTIAAISTGLLCVTLVVIVASIAAMCLHMHAKKTVKDNPIAMDKDLNNCEHQEMQKEECQVKVKCDPNPSYELVSLDRNPSYEVVSVDPDPSYEVV